MREVRILTWCDPCCADDDQTRTEAADTVTVRLPGMPKPRSLDVCEPHNRAILAPLAALVQEHGRPPAKTSPVLARYGMPSQSKDPRVQRRWTCPLCGDVTSEHHGPNHLYVIHCGGRPARPTTCPTCGDSFPSTKGCGTHRRLAHGWSPLDDALALAQKMAVT
jgi:hypothetical protein